MEQKTIENITVSVRIRPLNPRELASGGEKIWENSGSAVIKDKTGVRSFIYDQVYTETTDTQEIFINQGVEVIEKCMSGYNGCIFCYGQTGSGKTHTMHGVRKTNPGVVPLSIDYIFNTVQQSSNKEFLIRCSYIEIYNESINDLLNQSLLNLQIAEDKRNGIKIIGVTEEVCTSSAQVNSLLAIGEKHKNIASTNFNQRSSRSHSIFRVIVESKNTFGCTEVAVATLNLIDLAGSESANVHGPTANSARSKEMKCINRSLLTLGTVIMRLSDKKNNAPIPYRDSKLTRLLQPALEGNSKVSIICNISPCNDAFDETLSTLKFAQRAKKIKQVIVKNDTNDSKTLIIKYEKEISELQGRLREMEERMLKEEESARSIDKMKEIRMIQEEKERADANLEGILQEKIRLQQELERLKSFIICAEDVKPKVYSEDGSLDLASRRSGFFHSKTLHAKDLKLVEPLIGKDDNGNEKTKSKVLDEPFKKRRKVNRHDTFLLKGIDNIEQKLSIMEVEKTDFEDLLKINDSKPNNGLTIEELLKIIEDQRKTIENQKSIIEKQRYEKECFDKAFEEMNKEIEDKDEQIEILNDELKLCRNNLAQLQNKNRVKKVTNKISI
ncbi:hypothetical protein SteCoe_19521 [Stentor coeruleus]|uniref:Kinesin-like protein n=1 Tax=Stentor coeruleus TaxID=5963 RepID=A0A1R2BTW6_9CILI|nr:hypothetical protein SteCoe_19521 [Stentor coeruleus]